MKANFSETLKVLVVSKHKSFLGVLTVAAVYLIGRKLYQQSKKLKKKIYVINASEEWEHPYTILMKSLRSHAFIGIDCEWVSTSGKKRSKVSLMQIASATGICLLIRLNKWRGELPYSLFELLENENIYKTGVGIRQDCLYLKNDYGLNVGGWVDLRNLACFSLDYPLSKLGLSSLAKHFLQWELDKNWRVRCSDWNADQLTESQIDYAANDALVGALLYEKLSRNTVKSGLFEASSTYWKKVHIHWERFLKIDFCANGKKNYGCDSIKDVSESQRDGKAMKHPSRKSPLYDNCLLCAPDGEILCSCNEKKANWYCDRGLGFVSKKEPLTVTLYFEPKGRPISDDYYYVLQKDNICVVCGNESSYLRKNIVPHEYRKYFPNVMKDHQSHDILLLCLDCHYLSSQHDNSLKMNLLNELELEQNLTSKKFKEDVSLRNIRSAARALLKRDSIPSHRVDELKSILGNYFGDEEITDELLLTASGMNIMELGCDSKPVALQVVDYFSQNGGLIQLERRWREHFLETMKPRNLPPLWSVTHNTDRLMRKLNETPNDRDLISALYGLNNYFSDTKYLIYFI